MSKTLFQFAFLLIIPLSFCSCETNTYVDYYLDNQSSSAIFVSGKSIVHNNEVEKTILTFEKKSIASWGKFGKQTDLFEPSMFFGDDLIITNAQGDTLAKDYKLLDNWLSAVSEERAVANHHYTLVVTDLDF